MKRSEEMVFTPEDLKQALLWLCREELKIPSDYEFGRDVDVKITCPFSLNITSELEAIVSWETDD